MSVQALPEKLRSSVRSGVVLFDFARVVEELLFNTIDASASIVSVFVGVGTGYVKVVDNGYGISRDGLELLGQRYATSNFNHLVGSDAKIGGFGFRGESLASISDFSLLEVVTKAHGRPNGYRKVMKGSKCLFLRICDDMKDVGTTVVVRDLFYNQPVRRKYIQSSPKKVLQSIKKCVLRIALVHSKVSFKVVDVESEDVLLSTHASSPMSLLASYFGVDISSSLRELNVSDGKVKVSGYISGPRDNLTSEAFQYVYINYRFVCKGPIHKLVNQLSAKFECKDPLKALNGAQNKKRSRPQTCPAFILNIVCHRSLYDLTFEPTKTYVEFKDWVPILMLLEEAVQALWRENISNTDLLGKDQISVIAGNSVSEEDLGSVNFQRSFKMSKKKRTIEGQQACLDANCSHSNILNEAGNSWSHEVQDIIPTQHSPKYPDYLNEQENELNFFSQTNQNGDLPFCESMQVSRNSKNKMCISDKKLLFAKDDHLVNKAISGERCSYDAVGINFSSHWGNDSFEDNFGQSSNDKDMIWDMKKPVMRSCSLRGILAHESSLFPDDASDYPSDSFKTKEILNSSDERFSVPVIDSPNQSCEFSSRALWEDQASSFEHFLTVTRKSSPVAACDTLQGAFGKSIPIYEERLEGKDRFSPASVTKVNTTACDDLELNSEWCSLNSDSFSHGKLDDVERYTNISRRGGRRSIKGGSTKHFMDTEEIYSRYSYGLPANRSIQENYTTRHSRKGSEDAGSDHSRRSRDSNKKYFPEFTDIINDETEWLTVDTHCKYPKDSAVVNSQSGPPKYAKEHIFQIARGRSRSHSAPPFSRSKRRFLSLNCHFSADLNNNPASCGSFSKNLKNRQEFKEPEESIRKGERFTNPVSLIQDSPLIKEITSNEVQDSPNCGSKWRSCRSQTSKGNNVHDIHDQNNILDISSGLLHLSGDSLVPESISRTSLENAIVLEQVDKKFIPVVAGRTLAVVDQHAADERIRLEELREKVLSGEARTITFLEAEKELTVPELGCQLLHNYAAEIKDWGWICNIHAPESRSFKRNLNLLHRQPKAITLTAVPCILGVNLTDVDLMEFLQQLADTDGSSTMPPSVLRILNSKACRGAIMFGDSLLPSECSLLISELKQTSLCFQCAHGRPTTAPLANLEALHKQIAKIVLRNGDSTGLWHGLRRREITFERAVQRLTLATS